MTRKIVKHPNNWQLAIISNKNLAAKDNKRDQKNYADKYPKIHPIEEYKSEYCPILTVVELWLTRHLSVSLNISGSILN